MKKIILAAVTIITMMICIAQPLFVHAEFEHPYTELTELESGSLPTDIQNRLKGLSYFNNESQVHDDYYFIYFVLGRRLVDNPNKQRYYEFFMAFESADVEKNGSEIHISNGPNRYTKVWSYNSYNTSDGSNTMAINDFVFNFSDYTYSFTTSSNESLYFGTMGTGAQEYFCCPIVISNISELNNNLTVFVDFSPDLIGNVDRQITATDGTKSMRKDLAMQVINQSNFPIQYDMRIYKVNQNSSRDWSLNPETFATQFDSDSVSYDDDPVFIYYKNEWVYTTNYDSESTFWDLEPVKENKGASWHYLAANSQDIVTFNFTQINLDENVDYYVEVRAVRNDYGCSSEKIVFLASDNPAESEYKQIQGDDIVTVYHEQFKMINYSDVVYNPNEESNGVLPYNGKNGIVSRNTYQYGRNARDNGNGNIDYTARNLYTDQNSWYNQQYNRVVSNHTSNASSGSVPSNITNLFDSFMKFVSYVFLRFPANLQTIYVYGFVSVVVLGIVLKVIK